MQLSIKKNQTTQSKNQADDISPKTMYRWPETSEKMLNITNIRDANRTYGTIITSNLLKWPTSKFHKNKCWRG